MRIFNLYSSPNGDKVNENEMVGAFSTYERDHKCEIFGILKGVDHLEDLGVYGRIILK
jgi:hypothetical protein